MQKNESEQKKHNLIVILLRLFIEWNGILTSKTGCTVSDFLSGFVLLRHVVQK